MDDLARQWSDQHAHIRYTPVLSEAGPEPARVTLARKTGWVHDAVVERYPDLSRHEVYMSGPPPMIDAGYSAFAGKGITRGVPFFRFFRVCRRCTAHLML